MCGINNISVLPGAAHNHICIRIVYNDGIVASASNNIIVFPTGNWLTKEMYYNAQKNESYMLTNAVIEEGYITNNSDYADNLLDVSNDILIYDLIRNSRIKSSKVDENKIIGEVK